MKTPANSVETRAVLLDERHLVEVWAEGGGEEDVRHV